MILIKRVNPLGMYYLRTRPAADAIKFTVDVELLLGTATEKELLKSGLSPLNRVGHNGYKANGIKETEDEPNVEKESSYLKKKKRQYETKVLVNDQGEEFTIEKCLNCGS